MRENYSGERFDLAQQLATMLTERDRKEGRPAPRFGYSDENWDRADRAVRGAYDFRGACEALGLPLRA